LRPDVSTIFKFVESKEKLEIPFVDLPPERTLAIARTCTKLYNEAIPRYFGSNRFMFKGTWEMYAYLHMIGADRRACIRYISFAYQGSRLRQAFELLPECTTLRQLDVMVTTETMKGARKPQDDLFKAKGMGAFRAIRGLVGCKVTVREVVAIDEGTWRNPKWVFRSLNAEEKRRFDEENIKEVERVLNDEVGREGDTAEVQLQEAREDRKAKRDRSVEEWRGQQEKDWEEFEKKEAKRLKRDKGLKKTK
jgi:hypothetical protein